MLSDIKEFVARLRFSYEGGAPLSSGQLLLISELSALDAKGVHEALSMEFGLGTPFLTIGSAVSFYRLPAPKSRKRHSATFSDAFQYLSVVEVDGICHAIFIADVLTLADVINRLGSLSVI
ncbi:MAG: hypothetical protein ABIO21_09510 [Pseudomonas sp.]